MIKLPSPRPVLLDTSVVIEALRTNAAVLHQLASIKVYISAIVVGELYLGAQRSTKYAQEVTKITNMIAQSIVVSCDYDTGVLYGDVKAKLLSAGTPLPENDMWIAATAIQYQLPLATRDMHFQHIQGLVIETW